MLNTDQIEMHFFKGEEVNPYIESIANLRMNFFRGYPYLYAGNMEGERTYLSIYANSKKGLVIMVKDGERIIGAVTGVPLDESNPEIRQAFFEKAIDSKDIFYLGEMVLLNEYKGASLKEQIYQTLENQIKEIGGFNKIALCEIERPASTAIEAADYNSLENFWMTQGFYKSPELVTYFSWQEIGSKEETKHRMVFWMKDIELKSNQ